MQVRGTVTKALEGARADRFIGNSLAAKVTIECDDELRSFLEGFGEDIPDLFIVSGVSFGEAGGKYMQKSEDVDGLSVSVEQADGGKCVRCWKYQASVGSHEKHPAICDRCYSVLES